MDLFGNEQRKILSTNGTGNIAGLDFLYKKNWVLYTEATGVQPDKRKVIPIIKYERVTERWTDLQENPLLQRLLY